MRHTSITPDLFIKNRKKLQQQLLPNSLVVFNANDMMPRNTDGTMPFVQNSDLFYLTGIDQEETILLLYPDALKQEWQEILFIKATDELLATWEGNKYSKAEAEAMSGIATIHFIGEFHKIFQLLMGLTEYVYLNTNEYPRAECIVESRDQRFIQWAQKQYPLHGYKRVAPLMQKLRAIKEETEINLIQQACNITEAGFRSILPIIRPQVMEYEIEAQLAYEFIRRGSNGFAYNPILASGSDSCILHYIKNNKPCPAGGLLLIDVGAAYGNYGADMTRVVPISGKFTPRQKQVYHAVLRIVQLAESILMPGISFTDYKNAVAVQVEKELLALKLIDRTDIKNQTKSQPAYRKYFMHGVSHHLGLSTHDLGDSYGMILSNMVLTVEPGIYIKAEGIGIRLENNVVIREHGVENLMKNIPIDPEEIETLMQ
ncbi:MAG: aminopeptidase P N-terminal domain-containing protein [Amoebophilaceae bacterium]|nr:aminopeptidase P N-terminal domain-containing protein [Amoebophilaceae bacterium]